MPIIINSIAGKPNVDQVPQGYTILDWFKVEEGFIVLIHKI